MQVRKLAILVAALVALNAVLGGGGRVVMLCLGGGHQHSQAQTGHCESTCPHDTPWPIPLSDEHHGSECACTDVSFTLADLTAAPRNNDPGLLSPYLILPSQAWTVVSVECGLGRRGPPVPPPWFDPGEAQRLEAVASIRLTI